MEIIRKKVTDLEPREFMTFHLNIINPFIPFQLTKKEMEVLGAFMSFEGGLAEEDRFGPSFRKKVKEMLQQSSAGLSNHLRNLEEKGAIFEQDGKLEIQPFMFPTESVQRYEFLISKKS